MKLYKKYTAKPYFSLIYDNSLALDKAPRFRHYLSKIIWKVIITIGKKIKDEKLQYYLNSEAEKY